MTAPQRQAELLSRFTGSPDEFYEIENVGRFRVSGDLTLRVLDDNAADSWRRSVVPDHYMPLYGMKCGPPEYAGGLFEAVPFPAYDPNGTRYAGTNAPLPPEPIYDLCTDNCGCPFWVSADGTVYAHSFDDEVQRIGTLDAFVDLAVSLALDGERWYTQLNGFKGTARILHSRIFNMDERK